VVCDRVSFMVRVKVRMWLMFRSRVKAAVKVAS